MLVRLEFTGNMEALSGTGVGLRSIGSCGSGVRRITTTTRTSISGSHARRSVSLSIGATSSQRTAVVEFETGKYEKAKFAGDDFLAKVVTLIISIKPVYALLRLGTRDLMVRTATKNGISWKEIVEELKASDVFDEKEKLENTALVYPDYYTKSFHAYETGNLSWEAAFDVEPVTKVLWKRTYPKVESWQEAGELLRGKWLEAIESHHAEFSDGLPVRDILDVGCSTGFNNTSVLADHYNTAQVTGVDLSPYFLAVAQHKEKKLSAVAASRRKSILYMHANAEDTGLPSKSFDIVSVAYVLHECPQAASVNILKEAHRLLRPGGTIAITDQSPKSKVIQNLHPALFIMMKSTEPWLDEFYRLDLEAALQNCGFINVRSILTNPRHFTCTATVAM